MQLTVRPALMSDQQSIIALLMEFYADAVHWKKLFFKRAWSTPHEVIGYVLCDAEAVVGYLGVIFGHATIADQTKTICNITTWHVKPMYRRHSLLLMQAVLSLKAAIFTNLTPSELAAAWFRRAGFQPFATDYWRVLPLGGLDQSVHFLSGDRLLPYLDATEQRIYHAHQGLPCLHFLMHDHDKICYVIAVKTRIKKIPVAKIYYVSHRENFAWLLKKARLKLCWYLKICYLQVEAAYLDENLFFGLKKCILNQPRLYKSSDCTAAEVPLLYSELLVLGI